MRSYHHGNLRAALLERAEHTVRQQGAQALSLRELAREVGVSHGAPRRHFADREALLDALAVAGFERLTRELEAAVNDARPGFDARLRALGRAYVGFATRDASLLELMFAAKHREGAAPVRAAADRAFVIPLAVIGAGQQAGEIVPGDPESIALATFAMLQGLASMASGGMLGERDPDAAVATAIEQLLAGLRRREPLVRA